MQKDDLSQKLLAIMPDRLPVVLASVILLSSLWNLFLDGSFNPASFFFGFSVAFILVDFILYFRKRKILKEHENNSKG